MTTKKPLTAEERTKRLKDFKRVLPQIIEAQKRKEALMGIFNISKDEDKALDHMNVRALADTPEGSHAYFDTDGVFIDTPYGIVTKDFVISETPTTHITTEQDFSWMTDNWEP